MLVADLLRHGELVGGVKYRGRTDDPLTEEGRAAMDAVWRKLLGQIDCIVTSPLSRCKIPAAAWAEEARLPLCVDERIVELDYGAWEGLTPKEIEARFPGKLSKWRQNPEDVAIPDAEGIHALKARVEEAWKDWQKRFDDMHILVVGHSGSLRMLIAIAMEAPIRSMRRMVMPYACWSRLRAEEGRGVLEFFNR